MGPTPDLPFVFQDVRILSQIRPVDTVWRRDYPGRREIRAAVQARLRSTDYSCLYVWFAEPHDVLSLVGLSRRYRKPSVVIVGGYEVTHLPEIEYGGLCRLRDRLRVKLALRLATCVLPTSELLASEVRALGRKKDVTVIPPGIDCEFFRPGTGVRENLVITVATVSSETVRLKGLDVFARASLRLPDVSFSVLGPAEDDTSVSELKAMGGENLSIEDRQMSPEELRSWYQRAKVYAQLSVRESFGVALAEAMACGCRSVTTSRGALPEVAGPGAAYVRYGDADEAAAEISTALARGPSAAARERVEARFGVERRARSLIEIMSGLQ